MLPSDFAFPLEVVQYDRPNINVGLNQCMPIAHALVLGYLRIRCNALSQTLEGLPDGAPRAGDRFPWLKLRLRTNGYVEDVFQVLDDTRLNLIVVGQPMPGGALGGGDLVRVHAVPDDPVNDAAFERAKIPRPAFHLLRPDGHVGLCGTHVDAAAIARYVSDRLHIGN